MKDISKALYDLATKVENRKEVDKMDLVLKKLDKLIKLLTPPEPEPRDTRKFMTQRNKETGKITWRGWLHEDGTVTTEWESKL